MAGKVWTGDSVTSALIEAMESEINQQRGVVKQLEAELETVQRRASAAEAEAARLRALILSFSYSLAMDDHMGDVADDVDTVLKKIGVNIEWGEFPKLRRELEAMGIKSIYSPDNNKS